MISRRPNPPNDSNDISEMWREHHLESQERRAHHRMSSAQILEHHRVKFSAYNGGAHLIVGHNGKVADFWPGTGKWIARGGPTSRGVFPLLAWLEVTAE